MTKKIAMTGMALALAVGGVLGLSAPASAAENCAAWRVYGSQGHAGAEVKCGSSRTGYFAARIECQRLDDHSRYIHIGTTVPVGNYSVAWCDRYAKVTYMEGIDA